MPGPFAGGVRSRQSTASTRPKITRYSRAPGGGGLQAVWDSLIVPNAKAAFWAEDPLWTPPGDGNPVSSWRDAGSENKPATQATGSKQPDYVASVAALNNRPAIQGDGTDDFLQTAAWGSALSQPYYIFVVGSKTNNTILFDSATSTQVYFFEGAGAWRLNAGASLDGGTRDQNVHAFRFLLNAASSAIHVDGNATASGNAGTRALSGLTLGGTYLGTGVSGGYFALVAVIPAASLTAGQVTQIEQALGTHYGITVA